MNKQFVNKHSMLSFAIIRCKDLIQVNERLEDFYVISQTVKQCQLHNQQINFWIIVEKVKNPIHAVANVDDYGASARLLAATTLRCESEQDVDDDDNDDDVDVDDDDGEVDDGDDDRW